MSRGFRGLIPVVLAGLLTAGAQAQIVQSVSAPEPLFLHQGGGVACVELAGQDSRCFDLPGPGRVTALEATRDGWVAAGMAQVDESWRVFVLELRGDELSVLPLPPAGRQARRLGPVPMVEGGELAGLAWLEGPRQEEQGVWVADWDGAGWTRPLQVAAPGTQVALSGAVLAEGSWILLWTWNDGRDDETVYSRRRAAGWSAPRPLLGDNRVFDLSPAVVSFGDGALAAWSRFDGSDYRLVLARLEGSAWRELQELPGLGGEGAAFVRLGDRLWLLYHTAVPRSWNLVELGEGALPLEQTGQAAGSATQRPAVLLQEGSAELVWPDGGGPAAGDATPLPPSPATEGTPIFRYLAFGDSITAGTGCNTGGGYPGRLPDSGYLNCAANNCQVINRGDPGETTAGGVSRLPGVLDNQGPWDVLILMEGTNDICFTTRTNASVQNNLAIMESTATSRGVDTLHTTIIDLRNPGYPGHPCPADVGREDDFQPNQMGTRVRDNLANIDPDTGYRWWANTRSDTLGPPEVVSPQPLCNNNDPPHSGCFGSHYDDWGHPDCSGYNRLTDEIRDGVVGRPVPEAPTLVSPTGTINNSTPVLTWDKEASGNATWYHVDLDGPSGSVLDVWVSEVSACSTQCFRSAGFLPDGFYTWQIQGRNPHGRSAWAQGSFTVLTLLPPTAAVPLAPAGWIAEDLPTFEWQTETPPVATTYELEVQDEAGGTVFNDVFEALLICDAGLCQVAPLGTPLAPGPYSWQVRGENAAGQGPWTEPLEFIVEPALIFYDGFESGDTTAWSTTSP